jgi:subtilisin-like proprotein convertase family protein
MSSQHYGRSLRWQAALLGLGVAAAGLVMTTTAVAPAQAASTWSTYAGTGTGAIADGGNEPCAPGEPLKVEFEVSGLPVGPLRGVRVADLMIEHTWVGDLTATLTAPGGSTVVLFSRTGARVAESAGDSSNVRGPYTFSDTPTPHDWWAEADAQGDAGTIPAGRYRASAAGGAEGSGAVQPITAAFAGVADPNGTWTLSVTDRCFGEAGSVGAVDLQLQPSALGPGCASYQEAVDRAAGVVSTASTTVETARTTLVQASEAVGVAQLSRQLAAADVTRAAAAVTAATAGLRVAKARVTKAAKALKVAKRSHKSARIAKARSALKLAQARQKVAQTVATVRQEAATVAGAALAAATQAQVDRQVDRDAATAGLTTAQVALTDAVDLHADRRAELEQCLDV